MGGIFYFVGHSYSHMIHALPIYEKLGGEFIVLTEEGKSFCENKGVNVKLIDDNPQDAYFDEVDIEKVRNTLDYVNNQRGIVFFFSMLSVIPEIKSLKKIMLFHGNSLKNWFTERGIYRLNHCDYIMTLTYYRESVLRQNGVAAEKFVRIGLPRWDEIIKNKGQVKNQECVYEKLGLYNKKIITYFPTWIGDVTSVQYTGIEIVKNISDDYILLFRPHPVTSEDIIQKYLKIISKRKNILYVPENRYPDISLTDIFSISDMFIGDISSVVIDSILTEKPIILALDSKNVMDCSDFICFIKGIVKKLVYFGNDRFQSETIREQYKPIQEIFNVVEKVDTHNAFTINEKIEKSLKQGVNAQAWASVKNRWFYDLEGNSVEKLVDLVEKILKTAR